MSTCTRKVLIALKEKQLPFELIAVDMANKEHKSEAYRQKQPFGVIPYLDDDGFIIYESRAIARYLEAKYKGQGTELIPINVQDLGLFEQGASVETSYFDQASTIVVERFFKPVYYQIQGDEQVAKTAEAKLAANLDVYEKILSKQEYIGGKTFTLADAFHIPMGALLFVPAVNGASLINDRPHVKAWWEKITSRPSWVEITKQ